MLKAQPETQQKKLVLHVDTLHAMQQPKREDDGGLLTHAYNTCRCKPNRG